MVSEVKDSEDGNNRLYCSFLWCMEGDILDNKVEDGGLDKFLWEVEVVITGLFDNRVVVVDNVDILIGTVESDNIRLLLVYKLRKRLLAEVELIWREEIIIGEEDDETVVVDGANWLGAEVVEEREDKVGAEDTTFDTLSDDVDIL